MQRESTFQLQSYVNKKVMVELVGGRQVSGEVKGVDEQNNLILDNCYQNLREADLNVMGEKKQFIGLVVVKGNTIVEVCESEKMVEIENPYEQNE